MQSTSHFTKAKRKQMSKIAKKEAGAAYLYIAPLVLGLLIFYLLPAFSSLYISLTDWNGFTEMRLTGWQNYTQLLEDERFIRSLRNTFVYTILVVPLSIGIATLIAVLLNQSIRGVVIYRVIYFLPVVSMPVAVAMVWKWLYHSEYGLINFILSSLSLPTPAWLLDERFALFSIALVGIWSAFGTHTVILLAGLQSIPSSYYEAAELDGAGMFQRFFRITLPLLTPSLFFVLITSLIGTLQVFDLVFMMARDSNILESTRTIVYSVWENAFVFGKMGYASAQAWVLFLSILVITIVQMVGQKKWVHYN